MGNVMTLEQRLYSMRMVDLAAFAEKHGVKINKKGSKAIAIDKILMEMDDEIDEVEDQKAEVEIEEKLTEQEIEQPTEDQKKNPDPVEKTETPAPKRGALLEYNGKAQNICAWAKELGKSANTLYGRIYKLGWSIEDAFTK